MAPGCGVGITSIPREAELPEILKATLEARKAGMTKPSAKAAEMFRDPQWRKARPHLFFDSLKVAREKKHTVPKVSATAAAAGGSSAYCELIARMHGNLVYYSCVLT
jgi:hypothetical protein